MNPIEAALSKLDPTNDNHWTQDGLPRLDTVKILSGNPGLTREMVTDAVPGFSRASAQAAAEAGAGTPAQGTPPPAPPAPPSAAQQGDDSLPPLTPPPLAEETVDPEDLEGQIKEAKLRLSDAQDFVQRAREELVQAQNDLAALEAKQKEAVGPKQNPIRGYLDQQRRNLEERGARKELIKESGLDLKELAKGLKSPIDAAMARRDSRGASRPVRN